MVKSGLITINNVNILNISIFTVTRDNNFTDSLPKQTTVSGKVAGFGVQLQGEISGTKCSQTI